MAAAEGMYMCVVPAIMVAEGESGSGGEEEEARPRGGGGGVESSDCSPAADFHLVLSNSGEVLMAAAAEGKSTVLAGGG